MRLSALIVATAATVAGCGGSDVYYTPVGASAPPVIRTVPIATDVVVTPDEPGLGAGLFVDYLAGGSWRIQATCNVLEKVPCDFDASQECTPYPCVWDVVATALAGSLELSKAEIDPEDRIYRANDGGVRVWLITEAEIDSVSLTADPGERLQVDIFLDGFYDPTRVSWAGEDGTIETNGAPSNPVVFVPTSP